MAFPYFKHGLFHCLDFRKCLGVCAVKVSIEILADETGAVVAYKHPVWVHHGDDKQIVVVCKIVDFEHLVDEAFESPVGHRLCWMSASQYYDCLSDFFLFPHTGYLNQVNGESTERLPQLAYS